MLEMSATLQEEIDKKNMNFWNELCGSQLAKELGVTDSSPESLAKFDKFYEDYYPYLEKYLLLNEIKGKRVLEVGLGYGAVSQKLGLAGADYHGLDIAANAVGMAKHRLEQHGLTGDVRQGSMLTCPFPDDYFDYVISIGCFHHTGNMQECVNQTHRILKKNGKAVVMVYNKFSLRQWSNWPWITAKNLIVQMTSKDASNSSATEEQRKAYDASEAQHGAPETGFFSVKDIQQIFKAYQTMKVTRENFDEDFKINLGKFPLYRFKKRKECLDSDVARKFGLDLYIEATK
jgi:ubiquinone/menaquinone biosynthesis C-methylase UbiE